MCLTSSSEDSPASSSDDQTHSPVTVRWSRPDVPGCRFDAWEEDDCFKQFVLVSTYSDLCMCFKLGPMVPTFLHLKCSVCKCKSSNGTWHGSTASFTSSVQLVFQLYSHIHTFCTLVSKLGPMATNVCWRYFLSFAFLKKGCFKSSVAVGLQWNQTFMNSLSK